MRAPRTNFTTKAQAVAEVVRLRRLLAESEQLHVTYEGQQYDIPALWIAGFCQSAPVGLERSILDAVRCWYEQALLEPELPEGEE